MAHISCLRILTRAGFGSFALAAIFAGPAMTQNAPQNDSATKKLAGVRKVMAEVIRIPEEFKQPVPLKLVLQYVGDSLRMRKLELQVWIDQNAFKEESPEAPDLLENNIVLPKDPAEMSVAEIIAARQFPAKNAAVWPRPGHVEITTRKRTTNRTLLSQPIRLEAQHLTLREAIDEVAAELGVAIQIDPRSEAALKKPANVAIHGRTTARGLLTLWTDANGLSLLADDDRILIIPRANYLNKLQDELTEARLLAAIAESLRVQNEAAAKGKGPAEQK